MSEDHKNIHNHSKTLFISFEGIEGVGKSTQVQMLAEYLKKHEISCIKTREPGGTSLGNQIRSCLLQDHEHKVHAQTELCLLLAARYDHWHHIVRPALERQQVVIIDRFIDASMAYQGYGRGLGEQMVRNLHEQLSLWNEPDITFLLDMPIEQSRQRLDIRGFSDRIEKEKDEFFRKVQHGYRQQAEKCARMQVLDASLDRDDLAEQIAKKVLVELKKKQQS